MDPGRESSRHLDGEEVAAYLDRALPAAERTRVEAHLAECDLCRAEVVEVRRLLDTPLPARRRFPTVPAMLAAAAAAVAALFLLPPAAVPPPAPTGTLRVAEPAEQPDGLAPIRVVAPLSNVRVPPEDLVFTWRAEGDEVLYRFLLADETGAALWSVHTADTTVALPREIELRPGGAYFWHVDALLPDGRSATTRVQRLLVRP